MLVYQRVYYIIPELGDTLYLFLFFHGLCGQTFPMTRVSNDHLDGPHDHPIPRISLMMCIPNEDNDDGRYSTYMGV